MRISADTAGNFAYFEKTQGLVKSVQTWEEERQEWYAEYQEEYLEDNGSLDGIEPVEEFYAQEHRYTKPWEFFDVRDSESWIKGNLLRLQEMPDVELGLMLKCPVCDTLENCYLSKKTISPSEFRVDFYCLWNRVVERSPRFCKYAGRVLIEDYDDDVEDDEFGHFFYQGDPTTLHIKTYEEKQRLCFEYLKKEGDFSRLLKYIGEKFSSSKDALLTHLNKDCYYKDQVVDESIDYEDGETVRWITVQRCYEDGLLDLSDEQYEHILDCLASDDACFDSLSEDERGALFQMISQMERDEDARDLLDYRKRRAQNLINIAESRSPSDPNYIKTIEAAKELLISMIKKLPDFTFQFENTIQKAFNKRNFKGIIEMLKAVLSNDAETLSGGPLPNVLLLNPLLGQPKEIIVQTQHGTRKRSYELNTISDALLSQQVFPPLKYIVEGMFATGLNVLAGAPKIGKSWFAIWLCKAVAAGILAFGKKRVDRGSVLYCALEDNLLRLQDRSSKASHQGLDNLHYLIALPDLDLAIPLLQQWVDSVERPKLIVIDTMQRIKGHKGRGGNAYEEDYTKFSPLQKFARDNNIAVVVVHHLKKGETTDPLEQVSGSMGLVGVADVITVLQRERGKKDATLFVTGRDVLETTYSMEFNPVNCSWEICGELDDEIFADGVTAAERVYEFMKSSDEYDFTPKDLKDALDMPDKTVREALKTLVEGQKVVKVGHGRYVLKSSMLGKDPDV